jgi:hypothetical protein
MPKRSHGPLAASWFGAAAPTTGPTGTSTTWIGNVVQFTVPGRVAGFRTYMGTSGGDSVLYAMLDRNLSPPKYVATKGGWPIAGQPASWQQVWFRPWVRINTSHTYWILAVYIGGFFYRNTNALSGGPVTRNGIKMVNGFQTTTLDLPNTSPTVNANVNSIDVLFYAD